MEIVTFRNAYKSRVVRISPPHEIPGKGDVQIRYVSFFFASVPAVNHYGERINNDGNGTE